MPTVKMLGFGLLAAVATAAAIAKLDEKCVIEIHYDS